MTMAASLATGFLKTRPDLETPDIQFHVQPWSADSPGEGVHPFSAFTMSVCNCAPKAVAKSALMAPTRAAIQKSTPITCPLIWIARRWSKV